MAIKTRSYLYDDGVEAIVTLVVKKEVDDNGWEALFLGLNHRDFPGTTDNSASALLQETHVNSLPVGGSMLIGSSIHGIVVRCDKSYDRFRVFLNDVLHLSIEYKGMSIQSWKTDDANYCIEYRGLNGIKTLCEYDKNHVWEAILKNIVELKIA